MARNLTHVVKQGEVGKVVDFVIEDADGLVDLTNWTVTMNIRRDGVLVVEDAACTKKNQTTDRGEAYHTWANDTIPADNGTCKAELKLVNGPVTRFWPTSSDGTQTYFTVEVQQSLA